MAANITEMFNSTKKMLKRKQNEKKLKIHEFDS